MYRLSFATILLLAASLVLATSCKPKDTADTALDEAVQHEGAADASEDSAAEADDSDLADSDAVDSDLADGDEPEVRLNAPEGGLLGDQGLKNPQEADDSANEGGLKLQLGGGSGYGYQRSQPSLLDN